MRSRLLAIFVVFVSTAAADAQNAPKKQPAIINPPPTAQDYADLAKLPDWSGVWNPKISDQDQQARNNPPPWNEKVAKEVEKMWAEEKAGRPKLIFYGCFPEAHPSWMLVTHNAMEILFTPGRVTMLGESDGNRLRRIYTDGRPHPETPDPSFLAIRSAIGRVTRSSLTPSTSCRRRRSRSVRRSACQTTATCTSPNVSTLPKRTSCTSSLRLLRPASSPSPGRPRASSSASEHASSTLSRAYASWATTGKRMMRMATTYLFRSRRPSGAISSRRNNPANRIDLMTNNFRTIGVFAVARTVAAGIAS